MWSDLKNHVESCRICGAHHSKKAGKQRYLQSIAVHEPWEVVGVDLVGKLSQRTRGGYQYIIVFTDYLTKWVEAMPLKSISSTDMAKALYKLVIKQHGCPRHLISDQGSNFVSAAMHEVYHLFNLAKTRTTTWHPQCDGLTECFNKMLVTTLKKLVSGKHGEWSDLVDDAVFAYRLAVHEGPDRT